MIGLLTLIESRSDAHPYLPVIRVVVGVLEVVVVVAAVLAMFCGGFELSVGGTRLILAVSCGGDRYSCLHGLYVVVVTYCLDSGVSINTVW